MLRPYTFLLALLPSAVSLAQCETAVPSHAQVISNNGAYTVNGSVWICPGVTAELSGGLAFVYIENDVNVSASNNLSVFIVKAGATLSVTGFNANIIHDPEANIADPGAGTPTISECPDLTIDYADAPEGGCVLSNALAEQVRPDVQVFPNPAADRFTVRTGNATLLSVALYDVHGRQVNLAPPVYGVVDVACVAAGHYILLLHTTAGTTRSAIELH